MQFLAKFKNTLYMGFRATLNFRKFKMALNPICYILSCLSKFYNKKNFHRVDWVKAFKAEIKALLFLTLRK